MSGQDGISHVVVAAAGTCRLGSMVQRGCASIQGGAGHVTIVSLSTLLERIATRCLVSETWLPTLLSDDLVASRAPAFVEALLVCPTTVAVDYEFLVDWTPGSVLDTVLRAAPDAVVLDRRLPALRRAFRKHFVLRPGADESGSHGLFFTARAQPDPA